MLSLDSLQIFIAKAPNALIFFTIFSMKIKFMVHNIADDFFFFLHPHFHHCLGAFSSISASYKIR